MSTGIGQYSGTDATDSATFHTFHVHDRWITPCPDGNSLNTIKVGPQVQNVSRFEDTRICGPANPFEFTIECA